METLQQVQITKEEALRYSMLLWQEIQMINLETILNTDLIRLKGTTWRKTCDKYNIPQGVRSAIALSSNCPLCWYTIYQKPKNVTTCKECPALSIWGNKEWDSGMSPCAKVDLSPYNILYKSANDSRKVIKAIDEIVEGLTDLHTIHVLQSST